MGIILALVSFLLSLLVYVRMVRREIPEPLGKKQAIIPMAVGLAAPILATMLVIIFGLIIKATINMPLAGLSDSLIYKSLVTSFIGAGFTEEFVKFLLLLLLVKILKPKNVYEYVLFGVGIAVGFTLLEEGLSVCTWCLPFSWVRILQLPGIISRTGLAVSECTGSLDCFSPCCFTPFSMHRRLTIQLSW